MTLNTFVFWSFLAFWLVALVLLIRRERRRRRRNHYTAECSNIRIVNRKAA